MSVPVCVKDYEELAKERLSRPIWNFISTGVDEEWTVTENERAFRKWALRPRMLNDVSRVNLSTTLLGEPVAFPVGISPSATHCLYWADGEISTAKGSASMNSCYIVSSFATKSLDHIIQAVPEGLKWFQMYLLNDREQTAKLVRHAEQHGFKALVLTVDLPVPSNRRSNMRFPVEIPSHMSLCNFKDEGSAKGSFGSLSIKVRQIWSDIDWLAQISTLPVVLKGILTAEDAELAIQHGAAGIMVSNHGGRAMDTGLATIDVLPEIVAAVAGRAEVYIDGGIRMGSDVLKALALGAHAVFIGRPIIWGLACGGAKGVRNVLEMLQDELQTDMALCGCASLSDITPSLLVRKGRTCMHCARL